MVRARVRVNYHHTLLLQTTRNWLEKHSEQKSQVVAVLQMERVWASGKCPGNIQCGGQYKRTDGLQQAECNGNI